MGPSYMYTGLVQCQVCSVKVMEEKSWKLWVSFLCLFLGLSPPGNVHNIHYVHYHALHTQPHIFPAACQKRMQRSHGHALDNWVVWLQLQCISRHLMVTNTVTCNALCTNVTIPQMLIVPCRSLTLQMQTTNGPILKRRIKDIIYTYSMDLKSLRSCGWHQMLQSCWVWDDRHNDQFYMSAATCSFFSSVSTCKRQR